MKPIHRMTRFDMLTEVDKLRREKGVPAEECLSKLGTLAETNAWLRDKPITWAETIREEANNGHE